MASLELRNKTYRAVFMFRGNKFGYSLGTGDKETAESLLGGVEKTLMLIQNGAIEVPEDVDVVSFVRNGGKVTEAPKPATTPLTLQKLFEEYLAAQEQGSLEVNSLSTVRIHLNHIQKILGSRFTVRDLTMGDLQRYVNERKKVKHRGKPLSAVTLRKEVRALRACWNWGVAASLVSGTFPSKGLVYPKTDEKPPFMTRSEINKRIVPQMEDAEIAELWKCLYLTEEELPAFLQYVKDHARHNWIYPMVAFAAYTGARRSELLRARVSDVDLDDQTVIIREKKRSSKQRTTRRVPLTDFLRDVLREWLAVHPGGDSLFCHTAQVERSKKRGETTGHQSGKKRPKTQAGRMATVQKRKLPVTGELTEHEAHYHLRKTLQGGEWENLPGWHCLRHSFISACASKGVDQRLIDEWTGHSTEEQRKRYRHLYPSTQQQAINSVFG